MHDTLHPQAWWYRFELAELIDHPERVDGLPRNLRSNPAFLSILRDDNPAAWRLLQLAEEP